MIKVPPRKKINLIEMENIAIEAMTELEKNGIADLLLLKNDKLRAWWTDYKEYIAAVEAAKAEEERRERVKAEALARLSEEEKELLGLKPRKIVKRSRVWRDDNYEEEEEINAWDGDDETETEDGFEVEYHTSNGVTYKTLKIK